MKTLELYIHIPFCVRKCRYCDFLSFPANETEKRKYMEALLLEIRQKAAFCQDYEVSTIFFGGGTPSCIDAELFGEVMALLRGCYRIAPDAEITVECNPGTLTAEKLRSYRACGVNRLSVGLQSAEEKELRLLGRIHSYEDFLDNYLKAKECGFDNINIDLISSLPGQTAESFGRTLEKICALEPAHISVYSLIIEPGTPFYEQYEEDVLLREKGKPTRFLPDEEEEYRIGNTVKEILKKHGYKRYEISNYAREGCRCRHNIGYWDGTEYLGLGLGASSYIEGRRIRNTEDLQEYLRKTAAAKDPAAEVVETDRQMQMEEFMFLGLRMTDGVSGKRFEERFGCSMEEIYGEVLLKLQKEALLAREEDRFFLTEKGMDLANYCMAMFLE